MLNIPLLTSVRLIVKARPRFKTEVEPENLSDINYAYVGSNIIGGEFSEYFTPSLVREMKHRGMCEGDNTAFTIEASALHQETHLAQCLICEGRGFMGLKCQKCSCGVYIGSQSL